MENHTDAYIYDALRTPLGIGFSHGALYEVRPVRLLETLLRALQQRHELETSLIDDFIVGTVAPLDHQGGNIAKAALLAANWSPKVGGAQINRLCTSGLDAVIQAAANIRAGWYHLAVAGGVEKMSRSPNVAERSNLLYDPSLWALINYLPKGVAADLLATLHHFSRSDLDAYALQSQQRAVFSEQNNYFQRAIVPINDENGLLILDHDEAIHYDASEEKLTQLSPSFAALGESGFAAVALQKYPFLEKIQYLHTSGNTSSFADGAAALLLGSWEQGKKMSLSPRARIVSAATTASEPTLMWDGATQAIRLALQRAQWTEKDIDLWEINETFAAIPLHVQAAFSIPSERLNFCGGTIALGHPLGATGAVLLTTLLDELERRQLKTGVVALSAAGGMGAALIIERIEKG